MEQFSYNGRMMNVGKTAEKKVQDWLTSLGLDWIDVSEDTSYHSMDVDVLLRRTGGKDVMLEVKSDPYIGTYGSIFFELQRIYKNDNPEGSISKLGWSIRTKAQYIIYYCPTTNTIHRIATKDMRSAVQRLAKDDNLDIKIKNSDTEKTTIGVIIHKEYLKDMKTYKLEA